jgi:hypothetical protein
MLLFMRHVSKEDIHDDEFELKRIMAHSYYIILAVMRPIIGDTSLTSDTTKAPAAPYATKLRCCISLVFEVH